MNKEQDNPWAVIIRKDHVLVNPAGLKTLIRGESRTLQVWSFITLTLENKDTVIVFRKGYSQIKAIVKRGEMLMRYGEVASELQIPVKELKKHVRKLKKLNAIEVINRWTHTIIKPTEDKRI